MKEKGWKEGTGLGRTSSGIPEPVEAEGQSSHCKTGLGYIMMSYKITANNL